MKDYLGKNHSLTERDVALEQSGGSNDFPCMCEHNECQKTTSVIFFRAPL